MAKIEIEIPEDLERRAKLLNIELSFLILRMLKEKLKELEEIEHFEKSVAKSKLTEKDVEELTNKINTAVWEHHKKKYAL